MQYVTHKESLSKHMPAKKHMERMLFHGTNPQNVDGICVEAFNRSFSGQNGTIYGHGSYFARDMSYSKKYGSTVFVAKVLTGEFVLGNPSMRVPPQKPNSKVRYESVVDNVDNPTIFVTFTDMSAYPAYLITI